MSCHYTAKTVRHKLFSLITRPRVFSPRTQTSMKRSCVRGHFVSVGNRAASRVMLAAVKYALYHKNSHFCGERRFSIMKKYLYRNFIVIVFQNGKVAFQPNSFNCSVADSVTEAKKEIDLFGKSITLVSMKRKSNFVAFSFLSR